VECDVGDLFLNTTTTYVTSKGGITHTYFYKEVLQYNCYYGYKKANPSVIQCQYDGSWSSVPECSETGKIIPTHIYNIHSSNCSCMV